MANLYADENLPLAVVTALRGYGHDVVTPFEAGQANQAISDVAVLAFATSQNRAVLTLNRRDFIRLHSVHPHHAGIIVCTQDAQPERQAQQIHAALSAQGDLGGRLIRIVRPNV